MILTISVFIKTVGSISPITVVADNPIAASKLYTVGGWPPPVAPSWRIQQTAWAQGQGLAALSVMAARAC